MPLVHFLFEMLLNEMTVAAVSGHEIEHDDAAAMVVQMEPAGLVDQVGFNSGTVQGFEHQIGDGCGLSVGLEQFVHAVEHRQGGERNRTEHHNGDDERLPCALFLEHTPIGLVQEAHAVDCARVVEEGSPAKHWWARLDSIGALVGSAGIEPAIFAM